MPKSIVNLDQLEYVPFGYGAPPIPGGGEAPPSFESKRGDVGRRIGAQLLGANVTVVPPGKRAVPFHDHAINEEWFIVLDGSGEIRLGDERHPLRRGDVVCCNAGGPAHQIRNTGSADLRYLALSSMVPHEICRYPDSKKMATLRGYPGPDGTIVVQRAVMKDGTPALYWDGE
jgi:uncharacterized cupin superfamily protein